MNDLNRFQRFSGLRNSAQATLGRAALTVALGTLALAGASSARTDLPPGKCAALEPAGDDFVLASTGAEDRRFPDTATAANGDSIVVWEAFRSPFGTDDDRHSIHGRIYAEDGTPKGPQFQVNTKTVDEQRFPSVAVAPNGRFVVTWRSGKDASGPKEVRARVFAANGNPVGADFLVNSIVPNGDRDSRQTFPQAAMAASGAFLVTWDSAGSTGGDSSEASIQGRLFNAAGQPQTNQFQINSTTNGNQQRPDVAAGPNGNFLATWESQSSGGGDGSSLSVQARWIGGNGAFASAEFQVNAFSQGPQQRPAVAVGPGGQALVVWQSDGSSGSDNDGESIQARAVSALGGVFGPEFQVNQTVADDQLVPKVGAGPAGDFVVVWQSDSSPGADQDDRAILARHIASPGRFFDVEFQVNSSAVADQEFPAVSVGPNNAMVVFYSDSFGGALTFESLGQVLEGVVSANSLCLNQRRFLVQVDWETPQGATGEGSVVAGGSDDSGLFWFFEENNWEMLVKVLNGCGFNDRFWVFAAATTDVKYTLRVTDLFTGDQVEYLNPQGSAADAVTDTNAFAVCDVGAAGVTPIQLTQRQVDVTTLPSAPQGLGLSSVLDNREASDWLPGWSDGLETRGDGLVGTPAEQLVGTTQELCSPGTESLCLQQSRFEVTVDYRTRQGTSGQAKRVPFGSTDSGLLWFFDPNNWEMLVKVIDACAFTNTYWVFAAATTDVEYTLSVRDTQTGDVVEYFNPLDTAAPAITDTTAFATCQ